MSQTAPYAVPPRAAEARENLVAAPPSVGPLPPPPSPAGRVAGTLSSPQTALPELPLPEKMAEMLELAKAILDGLSQYGSELGVKGDSVALLQAAVGTVIAAEDSHRAALDTKQILNSTLTHVDGEAKLYLAVARQVLAHYHGAEWSAAWAAAGFPSRSTEVPESMGERQQLLGCLRAYFAQHGGHENGPRNVTATRAGSLAEELGAARKNFAAVLAHAIRHKVSRDAAAAVLRQRLGSLLDELGLLLAEDDPRWHAFGLSPVAAASASAIPTAPELLVVVPGMAGHVNADWARAARATRYRIYRQVMGVEARFKLAHVAEEGDVTLSSMPSGAQVRLRITAVNAAGESEPSEPVEVWVP